MRNYTFKGIILSIFTIFSIFNSAQLFPETGSDTINSQPGIIRNVIKKENNIKYAKNITKILDNIDEIYGNIYTKLQSGEKITVFFDPAHGRLKSGRWQSAVTGRLSCTGMPEEYYSILISQDIYKLLSKNRFITVKSTDDFLSVLKGNSSTYKNIAFPTTVKLAKKVNSFIIISEHLNNIGPIHKASGTTNLPGIHVTKNNWGRKYLTFIKNTYKGFLTLYNKLDITGFSNIYALKLKKKLVAKGLKANNWQYGAVADDRFSYFFDFPVSVIFESGFISNPKEEVRFRDPKFRKVLVRCQYKALLESIRDLFGVDISGKKPKRFKSRRKINLTILKLSRIALYYIKNSEPEKGISIINTINRNFKKSRYKQYLKPYNRIKWRLVKAEKTFRKGEKLVKSRKYKGKSKWKRKKYLRRYRRGKKLLLQGIRHLRGKPLFYSLRKKYSKEYRGLVVSRKKKKKIVKKKKVIPARQKKKLAKRKPKNILIKIRKAKLSTPIILAIEENQRLGDAIEKSLGPDKKTLKKLVKSFKNAKIIRRIRVKGYSKKRKKRIYYWKRVKRRVKFYTGIYIVSLNKKMRVKSVKRVRRVSLSQWRYQNHQYLKNSYFATGKKSRAL